MPEKKSLSTFSESLRGEVVVADTSSLLVAGTELLDNLPECTLVIPAVVVQELEEKRTHQSLGFLARQWLNLLESLRVTHGESLAQEPVATPEYPGVQLRVEPNHSHQSVLPKHLQNGSHDSTILAVAKSVSEDWGVRAVVLSNDTPMRLHATLDLGLRAHEFSTTLIKGAKPFSGRHRVELTEDEWVSTREVLGNHGTPLQDIVLKKLRQDEEVDAHALFVTAELEGNTKPLGYYHYRGGFVEPVAHKQTTSRVTPRTVEQDALVTLLRVDPEELPLVSVGGGAGTGKTLMATAVGLEELRSGNYAKMIVFRSLHEMGHGQEMGFLPGNVEEKMEAWAGAVYDALDVILEQEKPMKKLKGGIPSSAALTLQEQRRKEIRSQVEVQPITYLRGRSLNNAYIILDEAQNFSRSELLNILSRVGEHTKLVMTFDAAQVDSRYLQSGAKADIWSVIDDLKGSDLFAHLTLLQTERSRVAELSAALLGGY